MTEATNRYLVYPDEYNLAYFEVDENGLYHDAGYTDYRRENTWRRADYGAFAEETAARGGAPASQFDDIIARISGRFINADYFEIGCGYGYLGEAALAAGLNWTGVDTMLCYQKAAGIGYPAEAPNAAQFMVQGSSDFINPGTGAPWADSHPNGVDALTYLNAQSNKSIGCVISRRVLSVLPLDYLTELVTVMGRKSRDQIHVVQTSTNPLWSRTLTLQEWRDNFAWAKGTILVPDSNLTPEAAVVK